jgi:hypothetical protein
MQCLPSSDAHHHDQLPLFGFTARRLLTALLTEPGEQQLKLLAGTIANDPVLALWIALRAESAGHGPLVSVTTAASWFSAHWSTELNWPSGQARTLTRTRPAEGELPWQQRVRESVLAARLSRELMQMAAGVSESVADAAYWETLLEQSVAWAEDCAVQEDSTGLATVREFASRRLLPGDDFQTCLQQAKQLTARLLSAAAESLEVSAENGLAGFTSETLQAHLDYVRGEVDLAESSNQAVEVLNRLARLNQLESQFDDLLEQEKLAALKELAYGASHEINNPLANISSRAQTLLREESDPERQRMLATINSQAFRAHEMISDMMLFAKPPQMNRAPVDLGVMVSHVVEELADDAQRQGTALRFHDPQTPLVIPVDEIQLAEALKALCRNALESIGMGGEIDVSVEPILPLRLAQADAEASGHVDLPDSASVPLGATISVKDNGPGISEQIRAHLFDPFFSGREAGRGLGFGLSKCWRIVTEHGGQVEVHSTESDGTIFTLRLPVVSVEPGQGEAESRQAEAG